METKTAGIVIDAWKLPIFERRLTQAGHAYKKGGSPTPGTLLLTVTVPAAGQQALAQVILAANQEAARTGGITGTGR